MPIVPTWVAKNLQYIENANTTVSNISETIEAISFKTRKLSEISQNTASAAIENEKIIGKAISYMEEIDLSTTQNKDIIYSLSERSNIIAIASDTSIQSSVMQEILSLFNIIDSTPDDLLKL